MADVKFSSVADEFREPVPKGYRIQDTGYSKNKKCDNINKIKFYKGNKGNIRDFIKQTVYKPHRELNKIPSKL